MVSCLSSITYFKIWQDLVTEFRKLSTFQLQKLNKNKFKRNLIRYIYAGNHQNQNIDLLFKISKFFYEFGAEITLKKLLDIHED